MRDGHEIRFTELRADDDRVSGVLMPYGKPSKIGSFNEVFRAGAFGHLSDEIRANVQHDRTRAIARNRPGGGLTLTDSATELRAEIELPAKGDGPIVRELIERGVITGFSAEFRVLENGESWSGRSRTITRAELIGLGLVDQPAHADALLDLEARFARRGGDPRVHRRRFWF